MTMTISVPRIERQIEQTSFADLTASLLVEAHWSTADATFPTDGLRLTFETNLTTDEIVAVKIRCLTADANAETQLKAAYAAWKSNATYLAIVTPTTAQAVAQVRTLTQQMQGVFRYLVPID